MNALTDQQLLQHYVVERSEAAFAELTRRHVDLVYSAAFRLVGEDSAAKDVAQSVFVAMARNAATLRSHPVLAGWLHTTARNLSANVIRAEARRRAREQEAATMNTLLGPGSETDWQHIAPLLDEAIGQLSDEDRDAVVFRYFERKSAREMAQTLGISDDAAQKRVSRAVERLRQILSRNGVSVGTGGLVALISAHAVQAAPAGLAIAIASAASLAGTAVLTSSVATTTTTIAMTTLQKTIVAVAVISLAGVAVYEGRQVGQLRQENQSLRQQLAAVEGQIDELRTARDASRTQIAALQERLAKSNTPPTSEVLKLRSQVGALRQEKTEIGSKSALSKITADPETRKAIREQQRMGMSAVYSGLVKKLQLPPETAGQFKDLLADHVMENIELITQSLRDKTSGPELEQAFAIQDSRLHEKLGELLGPDGLSQYKDYSKSLITDLSVAQFEKNIEGADDIRSAKKQQLTEALHTEIQSALNAAGLPADYQTIPTLNLRNIASEEVGEQSLKLIADAFERVGQRAATFLTPDEVRKWADFKQAAIDNNRTSLLMNRKLMAPIGQ